jgi:hypothetical protein
MLRTANACRVMNAARPYAALVAIALARHSPTPVARAIGTMKPRSTIRTVQNALGPSAYSMAAAAEDSAPVSAISNSCVSQATLITTPAATRKAPKPRQPAPRHGRRGVERRP